MDYIKEVMEYIDSHIEDIHFPVHNLHERWNVSSHKLRRDFPQYAGKTLRRYLLNRKMDQIERILMINPKIDLETLREEAKLYVCLKTLKSYLKEMKSYRRGECFNINSFRNQSLLSQVLLRLVLLLEQAKPKCKGTTCTISHDVKNKIFQTTFLPIDTMHFYQIYFRPDEEDLLFESMTIKRGKDDPKFYFPYDLNIYLTLLYNLNKRLKKQLPFSLMDAVIDLETYIEKNGKIHIHKTPFYLIKAATKEIPELKINPESAFILQTNKYVENIRTTLLETFKKEVQSLYHTSFDIFQQYRNQVEERNYQEMTNILWEIPLHRREALDLIIEFTESPYWLDTFCQEAPNRIEENSSLYELPKEKVIDLILNFKKAYDSLPQEEDEDERQEFCFTDWFGAQSI